MKYDTDDIRNRLDCRQVAELLGIPKASNGRYIATWRGGKNGNVAMEKEKWYDHKEKKGGDVIELVMYARATVFPNACVWLGNQYGIEPIERAKVISGHSRYDKLIEQGYKEIEKYEYLDADSKPVQYVIRMEHPEPEKFDKEFLQCTPDGRWTLKSVTPVLYNLPVIKDSSWAIVVEGEKDADTLIAMGLPATTNPGGAKNWRESYSETLTGKDVVLMPDNDDAGRAHLDLVGRALDGKARRLRVLTPSSLAKGDVTDWVEKEGGDKGVLMSMLKKAQDWKRPDDFAVQLSMAKEANQKPFCNFTAHTMKQGNKTIVEKQSRHINALVEDAQMRLLGFPKKIGDYIMFDHDRDSGEIRYIRDSHGLFAWMSNKIGANVVWTKGESLVTKAEFFTEMVEQAERYESVSMVPAYPKRSDVYYAHEDLPKPSEGHSAFEGLLDFFNPEAPAFRTMIAAMFCSPMFYKAGEDKPMWIIDSHEGAGVGKSSLAYAVSELYNSAPIKVNFKVLNSPLGEEKVNKRIMSQDGRNAKVLLIDNVTGNFSSSALSDMLTAPTLSGMAPYGKGEENRPNDLTYIMTANSASVDNDIGIRSYYIYLNRVEYSTTWSRDLRRYISQNRMQIMADIIDRMANGPVYDEAPQTRCPGFETMILHKQCKNLAELKTTLATLQKVRDESNVEEDLAGTIREILSDNLERHHPTWEYHEFFVPSKMVWAWLKDEVDGFEKHTELVQKLRDLARNKLLGCVRPKVTRYPHNEENGIRKSSGVMIRGDKFDDETSNSYMMTSKSGDVAPQIVVARS